MEALELKAEVRHESGKHSKQLRRAGLVPAVLYGRNMETTLLQIEAKPLHKVLAEAGTHRLISVQIGAGRPQMTLARDIQRDPVKHSYLHVDFYAVNMSQKITADVPLVLAGEAPAVREGLGILIAGLAQVEVECLPGDLPASIEVAIVGLAEVGDTITVADLTIPGGVTILSDADSLVARIEPLRVEELEPLEGAGAEPEVVSRGKEKEEEEE